MRPCSSRTLPLPTLGSMFCATDKLTSRPLYQLKLLEDVSQPGCMTWGSACAMDKHHGSGKLRSARPFLPCLSLADQSRSTYDQVS